MVDEPDYMDEEQLWAALPDSSGFRRGDILVNLANRLNDSHDHERAAILAQEGASVFQAAGHLRETGLAHHLAGVLLGISGRQDEAYEHLVNARDLLLTNGEASDMRQVYEAMGNYHAMRFEWPEAIAQYTAMISSAQESNAWGRDMAMAKSNLAEVYETTGGHDDLVITLCQEALAVAAGDAPPHWIRGLRERLGLAHLRQGQREEAREHLQANLAVSRLCDCGYCVLDSLMTMAYLHRDDDDNQAATELYLEAIAISKERSGGQPTLMQGHYLLAQGGFASKDQATALKFIADATAVYETLNARHGLGNCQHLLGALARDRGDYHVAIDHYYAAGLEQSEGPNSRVDHDIARTVAQLHMAAGDPRAALTVLQMDHWQDHGPTIGSHDRAHHCSLYAMAELANGDNRSALLRAERLLTAISDSGWFDIQGQAHEVRALALRHADPLGSERAAQRAQACYNRAGMHTKATEIGTKFFIEPYESLTKIDVDNQVRAEAAAAERRVRETDAFTADMDAVAKSMMGDPIESQVTTQDAAPTDEAGAASA